MYVPLLWFMARENFKIVDAIIYRIRICKD